MFSSILDLFTSMKTPAPVVAAVVAAVVVEVVLGVAVVAGLAICSIFHKSNH